MANQISKEDLTFIRKKAFIQESLMKMNKDQDSGKLTMQMGTNMRDTGRTINKMAKVFTHGRMAADMKGSSTMGSFTGMEGDFISREMYIQEALNTIRRMEAGK
eukprot:CAMPEP_0168314148 /NCGR_PEP_ID=MMETSP0210-20121227/6591_1 /TAXON_ID=40633 /ORGANISM="Condylostoma magnum, Strain COL2" /LENGTH=103 /DNA_ID=CAMNT_0008279295 /DNA_START=605 /DNA_END=916 /DNA_ORIENTATION=-